MKTSPPRIKCSYIPPDGQTAIHDAEAQGGATAGDLRMLADRFRCRAEATFRADLEHADDEVLACADHLGHLLDDRRWTVETMDEGQPETLPRGENRVLPMRDFGGDYGS
jgi:hypothetical protein